MTVRLVAVPDVFLPDGTARRGDLADWLEQRKHRVPQMCQIIMAIAAVTEVADKLQQTLKSQAAIMEKLKTQMSDLA